MKKFTSELETIEELVKAYGPWSAMSIKLDDDTYTKTDHVDHRLRRIVQAASDAVGKPLEDCRVLDLACLEGQYAIEFALNGSEVVGVDLREANLAKASFAATKLGLDNAEFYVDDVNNLSLDKYGSFDIVICSGILYHLTGADACALIAKMHACCRGIVLIDTFISINGRETIEFEGRSVEGSRYHEHTSNSSDEEKLADLWASVENTASFWLSEAALANIVQDAGFSSFLELLMPEHPGHTIDRRTYLLFTGKRVKLFSSEQTDAARLPNFVKRDLKGLHPSQLEHSLLFRIGKTLLPQSVKDAIKPSLRRTGWLKTDEVPHYLNEQGKD
ncbi:class I SAM-dependent methyltransferase [Roseovarius atlanticus]|uniref:class I SAM-dependent methyltransferase n=1 Tax=Roseovarius atlanticus TaxID=1641875 RepID=UPI00070BAF4D|nr:class I SAM-dependent methyltransferase [Roseovarius atlanticus]